MIEVICTKCLFKSGQSLIEHSYKADSDLSPAGWEYAERLKEFVSERRAKSLEQRGLNPSGRRLVVSMQSHPTKYLFLNERSVAQIWTSSRRRAHHTAWPFLTDPHDLHTQSANLPHLISSTSGEKAIQTSPTTTVSVPLNVKVIEKTQMSEINPGVWDGLSPDQARKYYPEEWERFSKDPYSFRAPRAESYHDLSGE